MGSLTEEQLIEMVRDFIESEPTPPISMPISKSLSYNHPMLQEILCKSKDVEIELVQKISSYLTEMNLSEPPASNSIKNVAAKLKSDGYEACLCETAWVSTFDGPKDDYEYIDVMVMRRDENGSRQVRLIVDIEFRCQFELAKPTPAYKELTDSLPSVFVGTQTKLIKIICILCSAAEESLKEKGLHVPPWRKVNYMRSKWLSKNCTKVTPIITQLRSVCHL